MFEYLKNVISADSPERVSALIALIAGATLCLGFLVLIPQKGKSTELITVSAGLVSLATFAKDSVSKNKEKDKEKHEE